jgi:hypothetical protein
MIKIYPGIQHAMLMSHFILSFVADLDLPYYSTLSEKQHDFWENLLNIERVL